MRSFSKKLAFVLAAAMVVTAFAPAASAKAADEMAINAQGKILYVTDGTGINDADTLKNGKGNVAEYDFAVSNKPENWKADYTFTWSSSDDKIITVGKGGLTKAVAVGEADVICTVTEKATGKAVTLKNTVTVKANAADVELLNGADFEGKTVGANEVVNLDRVMYDAAGNKTTKKGTYVTDLTRWIAEPSTGVTINQKTGEFTFGEDAVAGDYKLYCETYQSKKYTDTTATSDAVVVTFVKDKTFEVKQDTVKKFTVNFDSKVESLGEVTVNRLFKGFEIPVLVKTATLAKDGMSAAVELYSDLKNNEEYAITVAGYEVYTLTASVGDPVEVLIYVDNKQIGSDAELVYIDGTVPAPVTLQYRLIDAKGVDVTDVAGGTVLFNAKTYSTDGSYYVSANQMWFAKEGVEIEVTADYQSGRYENGVQLAPAKGAKVFYSMKKDPVQVVGLADWKVAGTKDDWSDAKKTVAFRDTATLDLKIKLTEGDPVKLADFPAKNLGSIKFQELNPEVAALSGNNVVFFKQGVAKILVYYCYTENNALVELPIAQLNVEATAPKALQSMALDKNMVTLGTVDNYDEAVITVSAKNNYGEDYTVSKANVTIEGVDDNSKAALKEDVSYVIAADGKITLYGYELQQNTPNKPATVQLTFKVKVDGKLEQNVTVLLKSKGAEGTEYIMLEVGGDFGKDVARTAASTNVKEGTFTVYQYSNGIKVGTQEIKAYDANNITAGAYYFKVAKDGKDITDKVIATSDLANGKVAFKFSGAKDTVVSYDDFGAGNYVFTLYKGVEVAGKGVAVQVNSASGAVTCNVGSYSAATRINDKFVGDAIKSFSIKNTKGEDATAPFETKTTVTDSYVFVEYFVFRDAMGDGTFAEYKVNVGVALMK